MRSGAIWIFSAGSSKRPEFSAEAASTPDGWADTALGRVLGEAQALLLGEVEELPGDGPDHIERLAKSIERHVPAPDATPQDAADLREAMRAEDQRARLELPGDGQRPDLNGAISEVMRRAPRGVIFTRTQAEWIALGAVAAYGVVRDTERGDGQRPTLPVETWMVDYEHGDGEPQHAVLSWLDDEAKDLPEVGTQLVRKSDYDALLTGPASYSGVKRSEAAS